MPPRLVPLLFADASQWACARKGHPFQGVDAVHGRWTGLLLMAEFSVGRVSFGEPRWQRLPSGSWDNDAPMVWRLMWPCRACKAWYARPAAHRQAHADADRVRVARLASFGPF